MTRTLVSRARRIAAILTFGQLQSGPLLDPGQRLLGVDMGPGQGSVGQAEDAFGDDLLGTVQSGQEHARIIAHPIGDNAALGDLQVEGSLDKLTGNPSSFTASGSNSSVGRPQWPSSIASVSA
jgi:hypothetical protein